MCVCAENISFLFLFLYVSIVYEYFLLGRQVGRCLWSLKDLFISSFCKPGRWAGVRGVFEYCLRVVSASQAGGQVYVEFMSIVFK